MATDAGRTTMFNVQNIYGTPQISRRRQGQGLSKPRRMTLIDLRSVPLTDEDGKSERKGSSGTIKSESGVAHLHSHKPASELSQPTSPARRPSGSVSSASTVTGGGGGGGGMKVKHSAISPPLVGGGAAGGAGGGGGGSGDHTRFPKLEEYAHFHYDLVEIPSLSVSICSEDAVGCKHSSADHAEDSGIFFVTVRGSAPKPWLIRRTLENFVTLDKQLHKCIFDRRFSHLEDLSTAELEVGTMPKSEVQAILQKYLTHLSELAGGMVNCGSVLSWMEMDNRGHRLVATDDSGINTPAIAAAHVVKRYTAQAADEISLQVGDMISVIDMPPAEDTIWWRGKRGFEVGFFPSECVEVIGDKVPTSMASRVPEPLVAASASVSTAAAASRKPCEKLEGTTTATTPSSLSSSSSASSSPSSPPSSPPPSVLSISSSRAHHTNLATSNTSSSISSAASHPPAHPHHTPPPPPPRRPPHQTSSFSSASAKSASVSSSSSTTPSPSPSRASTGTAASLGVFSLSQSAHESLQGSSPTSSPSTEKPDLGDGNDVMRKHGKLMSFLRTFFSHRPPRNQLKQSGIVKERVFGCDLGEHLLNSGHDVPLLLKSCTDIIEEYGIVHGIYRLSGITSNIQKLRLAFDEDRVPDLTDECYLQDIHSISSLLKMYFRELPNPLLTYQLYDKFAAAVRDEDNKLLKIHDVVQQLPPPHYRTTEYLMRHLARVAAFGPETEMHSKNLAIVWAPNLLRSKELEAGGGAAALQGVGIQAVVTECLICYCDIIFSDKMPNYSSLDSSNQKKPRPKSLAISTPTRLLSLEEARERAFVGHLSNLAPKKFIDVGGGPKNLPSKYHTVIDLPGYKKKVNSSSKENKPNASSKKSGSGTNTSGGGWKSIFSKPRGGSVKKTRKPSQESVTLGPVQAKALTEEDVHNWKRHHLRSAKSAESLFSPSTGTPHSSPSCTSMNLDGASGPPSSQQLGRKEGSRPLYHLSHKRSLSSDASTVLKSRQVNREQSALASPSLDTDEDSGPRQFTREDSKRKALHRRIPSAPNTPREDRKPPCPGRSSSVSRDEVSGSGEDMDISLEDFIYPKSESRGDVNIDAAIKSRLLQVAERTRSAKSNEELASSPLKRSANTPPKGRKKVKAENSNLAHSPQRLSPNAPASSRRVHRSSSDVSGALDSSPYDNDDRESRMRRFYSRFHDYAEIVSVDDTEMRGHGVSGSSSVTPGSQGTPGSMSVSSSGCNMQDVLDQIDSRLAMNAKLFPRHQPQVNPSAAAVIDCIQQQNSSTENGLAKETVFSTSVQTSTVSAPDNQFHGSRQEMDLSLNLVNSISPLQQSSAERRPSPSGSLRQTEFPAGLNTSPRELIEQETMRKLLGLDDAGGSFKTSFDANTALKSSNSSGSVGSSVPPVSSTRVVRRRAEFIPSASASGQDLDNLNDLLDSLEKQEPRARRRSSRKKGSPRGGGSQSSSSSSRPSPVGSQLQSPHVPNPGHQHHHHPHHLSAHNQQQGSTVNNSCPPYLLAKTPTGMDSQTSALVEREGQSRLPTAGQVQVGGFQPGGITKCLSVPSDIAKSLENVTESQSDMLSSVTISELSASMSSFSNGAATAGGDFRGVSSVVLPSHHLTRRVPAHQRDSADPRHRRSSSLDSLTDSDRLLTRTLRDINRQMDAAFRHEGSPAGLGGGDSAMSRHHRLAASDLELSTSPEVRATPLVFNKQDQDLTQQAQDESQWVSTDSIGQFQVSDQSVTPTQATMDEAFKLFTEKEHNFSDGLGAVDSARKRSEADSDSDLDDDQPPSGVSGVVALQQGASDSFLDVNMMTPSSGSHSSAQKKTQEASMPPPTEGFHSSHDFPGTISHGQQREKQTRPHHDDQMVVESPQLARVSAGRTGAAAPSAVTLAATTLAQPPHPHHKQHHPNPRYSSHHRNKRKSTDGVPVREVQGRADVASMCINRSVSSTSSSSSSSTSSSEEFDEVASPEEDEDGTQEKQPQRLGGGRRSLTLPLAQVGTSQRGSANPAGERSHSALSPSDVPVYAVVRRQHSPRSPSSAQWSPSNQRSAEFNAANDGAGVNQNQSWELDGDASERMSSLCAAGIMSQRARLSRESSSSSLQQSVSPDSSFSQALPAGGAGNHVRSPLATPVREALPDIIQSTTPLSSEPLFARGVSATNAVNERAIRNEEDRSSARSGISSSSSNMPLQLALYHPDEFSMDIPPAAVSKPPSSPRHHPCVHQSPSLPQVHTAQEGPASDGMPLRKSSTDDAISSVASPPPSSRRAPLQTASPRRAAQGITTSASADLQIVSGNIRLPSSLSVDSASGYSSRYGRERTTGAGARYGGGGGADPNPASPQTFRSRAGSDSRAIRAAAHQLQMERYRENLRAGDGQDQREHVAMEVDNLCNRLVDRLTSPRARRAPVGGYPPCPDSVCSPPVSRSAQQTVAMDTSAFQNGLEATYSQPVPRESSSASARSSRRDSARGMQSSTGREEAENVLNRSREVLQYPVAIERDEPPRPSAALTSAQAAGSTAQAGEKRRDNLSAPGADSGVAVRKTSFSKIPRPRQSVDLSSQKLAGNVSVKKTDPSSSGFAPSMSSSTHADFSPSSSSTSSSTASASSSRQQAPRSSRRASETPGASKRSSQARRSSDTKLISDLQSASHHSSPRPQPSPTPSSSSTSFSRSSSGGSGRGRQSVESKSQCQSQAAGSLPSSSPSSRIPLSHRVPSPQSCEGSPSLGVPRQASKTKSPTPKPRKTSFNAKGDQAKGQSPSSESSSRGDSTPRSASRRETSGKVGGRPTAARKELESGQKKSTVVKPLQDESGARLVIETQPEMRQKVHTVHAKKVSQPPRQLAEGVGESETKADMAGNSRTSIGAGGRRNAPSQQQGNSTCVSFSDETYIPPSSPPSSSSSSRKIPPPVAKRKFRYDSRSLPRKSKQCDSQTGGESQVTLCTGSYQEPSSMVSPPGTLAEYAEMIGSRSSLDDSVLQLAAERQEDLFSPEELAEHHKNYGYSTGSLRAKRSVKLQSLLDLFEHKDSDSNVSDSSCGSPKLQTRERLHSNSSAVAPLAPCVEVKAGDAGANVLKQKDPFPSETKSWEGQRLDQGLAVTPRTDGMREPRGLAEPLAAVMMRSMPEPGAASMRREEQGGSTSVDPIPNRRLSASEKLLAQQSPANRRQPPSSQSVQNSQPSKESSREARPPRHRNNSRSSAVGTVEADGISLSQASHRPPSLSSPSRHTANEVFSPAPSPDPHAAVFMRCQSSPGEDLTSRGASSSLSPPSSPKKASVERRNSIKDLLQVFERQDSDAASRGGGGGGNAETVHHPASPTQRTQPRERLGSSSPPYHEHQQRGVLPSMRLSLEIPPSSDMLLSSGPLSQPDVKTQPLRLGPKPFYGVNK